MYEPKIFKVPKLDGISEESVKQHIGLYEGYVKNFNAIKVEMDAIMPQMDKHPLALAELQRRLSFEFGGMRLHEYYFEQFEGGPKGLDPAGAFAQEVVKEMGSTAQLEAWVRGVAGLRGPGWAILYWDPIGKCLQAGFTGEQHQGHFVTLPVLLALDVWEHTYVLDYGAAGKGKYVDAFFKNLDWSLVEKRFSEVAA